jgi:hypothetical protein
MISIQGPESGTGDLADLSKEIRGFLSKESGIVLKDLAGLLLATGSLTHYRPQVPARPGNRRDPVAGERQRSRKVALSI